MKKKLVFILIAILLVTLTACAPGSSTELNQNDSQIKLTTPGPNPAVGQPAEDGQVAGLGTGLWHGLISVVTLIISFSNPETQMYEVHNTGSLYNLGYLLGIALLFMIIGYSGGSRRRR